MSIFGKIGGAVGLGAVKQAGKALGVMSPNTASGLGLSKMPGANVQGGLAPGKARLSGPMGIGRLIAGKLGASPMAGTAAPPLMAGAPPQTAQMGMVPSGGATAPALQGAMQQMRQAGPPPQPFLESVQQAIAPPEFSDPYEAQKQRRIRGY